MDHRTRRVRAKLFASFLEKLQATPDGDGNLLDHSLFLYGAGLSNSNLHTHYDLPLAVVGGGPGFHKANRDPLYAIEDLDIWASELIGPRIRSTSEIARRVAYSFP
jgi:hypothetical protein